MPNTERPSKEPKRPALPGSGSGFPPQWKNILWYVLITVFFLWMWQGVFNSMSVRTIPYSTFKEYVAKGEVAECHIAQDEITGRIVPKTEAPASHPTPPHNADQPPAKPTEVEPSAGKPTAAKPGPVKPSPAKADTAKPSPTSASSAHPSAATTSSTPSASTVSAAAQAPPKSFDFRTIPIDDPKLVEELTAKHIEFSGERPSMLGPLLWGWLFPIVIFAAIWFFISRRMGMAGQAVMNIGKSKAKLVADTDTGVTFADVAGCEEAKYELQEVVDFLKNPARYQILGAKIPKGILLVGPPGTGKTLLSRAVAGEAHVPFFSLSGSDFVEMFVGVGAARVRDLFQEAKKHAPCIIFIDEVDAIGRQRSAHVGPVNDKREQTLNQLLAEMDGFEANVGVLILAATNRPEVLDRALLRPGRFDRQVVVDAPDVDGREAILKVHAGDKRLGADANLRKIAQATVGFSGADLANALNEAALLAARRGGTEIVQRDLEDAIEKVVAGPERRSRRLEPGQKRRVAFHEVGHALVAAHSEHADPVHKISIVPRGRAALGYTLQLPTEDQFLMTRADLVDRIKGMLGGRAAEEVVFGEISTGAENDLEHATALARQMVCMYGMSDALGLVHWAQRQDGYFPDVPGLAPARDCSEETARQIDLEVKRLLDDAHLEALDILKEHRDQLDLVSEELLKRETLDSADFYRLIGKSPAPQKESSIPLESVESGTAG